MNLLDHLEKEHRDAESVMDRLDATEDADRRRELIDELETMLDTHMAVEEQFLYPVVEEVIGSEDREEALNEHDLARKGLDELRTLLAEPGFGAALAMLRAGIDHHVQEEETEMFPELRQKAGERIEAFNPEALELQVDNTRDELIDLAAEAGVEGRSSMTKAELAESTVEP